MNRSPHNNILALDVGERIIGVAIYIVKNTNSANNTGHIDEINNLHKTPAKNSFEITSPQPTSVVIPPDNVNNVKHELSRSHKTKSQHSTGSQYSTKSQDSSPLHQSPSIQSPPASSTAATEHSANGICLPLTPLLRKNNSLKLGALKRIINRYHITTIVIGLPKISDMNEMIALKQPINSSSHPANDHKKETMHHRKNLDPRHHIKNHSKNNPHNLNTKPSYPIHVPTNHRLKKIKAYFHKIRKHFPQIHVTTISEAYTSWIVTQNFRGIRKNTSAFGQDSLAALELLKSYLAEINS